MWGYILKRIVLFFPTMLGIILCSFLILQTVPGGPVEQMVSSWQAHSQGEESGLGSTDRLGAGNLEAEQIEYLNQLYGFDKPLIEQFWNWLKRLFTFQFGESYYHNKTVVELVVEKMPVSISLGGFSFILTYLICIPLGIAKAVRHGSTFDVASSMVVMIGYSIPGFVLGVILIVLFGGGTLWSLFPLRGLVSDNFETLSWWGQIKDYLWHLTLPLICYVIGSFSVLTMLTKNSFLEQISEQYAVTARAKGLSQNQVLYGHVLKNALIPIVLGFPGSFLALFFTGSLLIETLFSLDGLGLLSYQSVISRDYPVVMATLFFFSILYLVGNLLSDLLLVVIDPRISFTKSD